MAKHMACCLCHAALLLADCPQYPGYTLRLGERLECSAGGDPASANKGESHPARAFIACQSRPTCLGFNAHMTGNLACYHTAEAFKTTAVGSKLCSGVYVKDNQTAPTGACGCGTQLACCRKY